MIIDCSHCSVRRDACDGCLVSTLLNTPEGIGDLTPGELRAIEVFELAGFEVQLLQTPPAPASARVVPIRRHVA